MGGAALLLTLVFAVGLRSNLHADSGWGARYADVVLKTVPRDAIVFGGGDADLAPIAYFHLIEGRRPDITLYQPQGLLLGNRLFHILRVSTTTMRQRITGLIDSESRPVVFTAGHIEGYARRDRWLVREVDRSSSDPKRVTVDIPEDFVRFFEESVLDVSEDNAWIAYLQGEYRRLYAALLMQTLRRDQPLNERTRRHIEALSRDFYGALGLAEGAIANKQGYSVGQTLAFIEAARDAMPADAAKQHKARLFELRAYLRLETADRPGAIRDLDMAVTLWPVTDNAATVALDKLYAEAKDQGSRQAMWARIKR
jgi:hypothetical protein